MKGLKPIKELRGVIQQERMRFYSIHKQEA